MARIHQFKLIIPPHRLFISLCVIVLEVISCCFTTASLLQQSTASYCSVWESISWMFAIKRLSNIYFDSICNGCMQCVVQKAENTNWHAYILLLQSKAKVYWEGKLTEVGEKCYFKKLFYRRCIFLKVVNIFWRWIFLLPSTFLSMCVCLLWKKILHCIIKRNTILFTPLHFYIYTTRFYL